MSTLKFMKFHRFPFETLRKFGDMFANILRKSSRKRNLAQSFLQSENLGELWELAESQARVSARDSSFSCRNRNPGEKQSWQCDVHHVLMKGWTKRVQFFSSFSSPGGGLRRAFHE